MEAGFESSQQYWSTDDDCNFSLPKRGMACLEKVVPQLESSQKKANYLLSSANNLLDVGSMKRNEQELLHERLDNLRKRIKEWEKDNDMPSDQCEVIISDLKHQKQEVSSEIYNMAQQNFDNSTK